MACGGAGGGDRTPGLTVRGFRVPDAVGQGDVSAQPSDGDVQSRGVPDTSGVLGQDPGPVGPEPDPGPPAGPVDACHATARGELTQGTDPIVYDGQPVAVTASHLSGTRCLTSLKIVFTRQGKCPLTIAYVPGAAGIWSVESATLTSHAECGQGWGSGKTYAGVLGESKASLLGAPEMVALPDGDLSCTLLQAKVSLVGTLAMKSDTKQIEVGLTGLGFDGALLSKAAPGGGCGVSPDVCQGIQCGMDPYFEMNCGACGNGYYCSAGKCVEGTPAEEACARFQQDRAALFEGTWGGSAATCSAGAMSADWQARAILSVNLYRWFAGLPPLKLDSAAVPAEQACALMMHANHSLSHSPPGFWACYTSAGAGAAGSSNLATMPAVSAVDLYMVDPGNGSTLGHRRWILSSWLTSTAFGSTSDYSCMRTSGYGGGGAKPYTAWPPPGYYPMGWHSAGWSSIDDTGWHIQSDTIALSGMSQVTVTENGKSRPVKVYGLSGGYGSQYAIKVVPSGWKLAAGAKYGVTVAGASKPVSYSFETLDCSKM